MNKAIVLLAAGASLLAAPVMAAPRLTGEARLADILKGRVPGKPVDCIDPRINSDTQIVDGTAIVYGSGRTVYVQRPDNARSLRSDDMLVTTLRGSSQLCSIDVVHLHDRSGGWNRGFVSLNKFVPYTREHVARN